MESEKIKEIKKVLEEGQFNTIKHHQKEGKPILVSFADILTLINELESENERLKRSNKNIRFVNNVVAKDNIKFKDRIAELENKIENGTLIEVLFKAGDIVYQLDNGGRIYENEIKSIYYVNNTLFYDCGSFAFDNTAIGEGIYPTKAEAEKKIKELKDEKLL